MEVVVQLSPGATAAFAHEAEEGPREKLVPELEELGLSLTPMHPGESDPRLASYFTVEVTDAKAADQAIDALLQSDAVEAAYVKPRAEPP